MSAKKNLIFSLSFIAILGSTISLAETTTETKEVTQTTATSEQTTTTSVKTTKVTKTSTNSVDLLGIKVPYPQRITSYRPLISIGIGAAGAYNITRSENFPVSPLTGSFYNYDAREAWQTAELFEGFIGVESPQDPCWFWQLGIDFNQAGNFHPKGTLTQGTTLTTAGQYNYRYNVVSRQLLLQGKIITPVRYYFFPYALLGVGGAFNTASDFQTNVPTTITTRQFDDRDESYLSYQVGAGVDVAINSNFRIGFSYRFADLGRVSLGQSTLGGMDVPGTLSTRHLYLHKLLAEVTFLM